MYRNTNEIGSRKTRIILERSWSRQGCRGIKNALKPFRFALLTIGKQYNNIIKSPAPIFGMAFFTSAIATLQTLVVALGAGLGVWGAINLLEGYGNDNPGAKSQGMKHVIPN